MTTNITNKQLQNMLHKYSDNIKINFVTDAQNIFMWYGTEKPDWAIRVEQCTPELLNVYIAEYNKPVSEIATLKQSNEQMQQRIKELQELSLDSDTKRGELLVRVAELEEALGKILDDAKHEGLEIDEAIEQLLNKEG